MTRHDGEPESRNGFRDVYRDLDLDGWPEAADNSWPDAPGREDTEQPSAGPAAWSAASDGGPPTESFTLDFTALSAAAPPPAPLEPAPPPSPLAPAPSLPPLEPAAPLPPYAPAESGLVDAPPSPATSPTPAPTPAATPTAAPAPAAYPPPSPLEDSRWDIPPVPAGGALVGAESLTADTVLRHRRDRPRSGWRKTVYAVTGGRVNFGPSAADRHRDDLVERARTPVTGCHRLAVISLKGGVGKTTTTAALGAMFADLRGDRVIAVDANPDRGTLGERVPRESGATVRHLLEARAQLQRYADVRAFTSQSPTRLEVLASDSDPGASMAFGEQDYRDTVTTLERFYNLILTDCGTGLLHSAMHGILGLASSLVVVSSPSLDGARSASATLDWLEAHGFDQLARNAVVVISSVRPGGGMVDVMHLEDHFAARCRDVVTIPYDPHLEAGGVLDLRELSPRTRDAYLELAAAVGEGFEPVH